MSTDDNQRASQWVYVMLVKGESDRLPCLYRKDETKLTSTEVAILKQPSSFALGNLVDYAIDRNPGRGGYDEDEFKKAYVDYQQALVRAELVITFKNIHDDFKWWEKMSYGTYADCSRLIVLNSWSPDDEDDD